MESTDLKIFREAAYARSISKASKNLGYVQSNVTAHIKKLEAELNTELFVRHNKGVSLTRDGEHLLAYADKVAALLNEAEQSLSAAKTLKIGTTQTIAGYFLPEYLMLYQTKYPGTNVSVNTGIQEKLENDLLLGKSDCILTNSSHRFANAKEILRLKEELVLITPQTCKSIEDAWSFPVITNNIPDCPYRKILFDQISSRQLKSSKVFEYDSPEGILNAAALGMGISLLPKHTAAGKKGIRMFPLTGCPSSSIRLLVPDHIHENPQVMSLKLLLPHSKNGSGPAV